MGGWWCREGAMASFESESCHVTCTEGTSDRFISVFWAGVARDWTIFVDSGSFWDPRSFCGFQRMIDYTMKVAFAAHLKSTKIASYEKCPEKNSSQRPNAEMSVRQSGNLSWDFHWQNTQHLQWRERFDTVLGSTREITWLIHMWHDRRLQHLFFLGGETPNQTLD